MTVSLNLKPCVCNMLTLGLTVEEAVRDGYDELGGIYCPEDDHTSVALKFEIKQVGESPIGVDLILSPYFSSQHELLTSLRRVDKFKQLKM